MTLAVYSSWRSFVRHGKCSYSMGLQRSFSWVIMNFVKRFFCVYRDNRIVFLYKSVCMAHPYNSVILIFKKLLNQLHFWVEIHCHTYFFYITWFDMLKFKNFCNCIYEEYWFVLLLVYFSGLDIKLIYLPHWMSWEVFSYFKFSGWVNKEFVLFFSLNIC